MRSAGEIITYWYNSKEVNRVISKMEPAELREELKQELFLALLEKENKEPGFLQAVDERGELVFYIARIITNMVKSSTSAFFTKYRSSAVIPSLPNGVELENDFALSEDAWPQ